MDMGRHLVSINRTNKRIIEKKKAEFVKKIKNNYPERIVVENILPRCSHCKRVRNDEGDWCQLPDYFEMPSDVIFSHTVCPECGKKYYADLNVFKNSGS